MVEHSETTTQATSSESVEHPPIYETVRKVLLASVGAIALAQDEIVDFVNRLVERGEIAERDGKRLIRELIDQRRQQSSKAEVEIRKRVEAMLERLNVPTRADIEALNERIAELNHKVDQLKRSQARPKQ